MTDATMKGSISVKKYKMKRKNKILNFFTTEIIFFFSC